MATRYAVEISDDGERWGTDVCNVKTNHFRVCRVWMGTSQTQYTHTTYLGGGAPLYYRIFVDYPGTADDTTSDVVSATPWNTPSATVQRAAGDAGKSTINVSWTPVTALGPHTVTGYGIQFTAGDGTTWQTLVENTGNTNTTYAHQSLPRGAFRRYSVRAIAGPHRSGWGPTDFARTTPDSPSKPVVTLTYGYGMNSSFKVYRLSWPRVDDGAEGYLSVNYQFSYRNIQSFPSLPPRPVIISNNIQTTEDRTQDFVEVQGPYRSVRTIRIRAVHSGADCTGGGPCEGAGEWSDRPQVVIPKPPAFPPVGQQSEAAGFTARYEGLPESHDGSGAFSFELRFSEAPEGLSYTTVANGLLDVTGATVTKAAAPDAGQQPRLGSDGDADPVGRYRHPAARAGVQRDERGLRGREPAWRGGLGDGAGGAVHGGVLARAGGARRGGGVRHQAST